MTVTLISKNNFKRSDGCQAELVEAHYSNNCFKRRTGTQWT